ncbi:MAG: DUF4230 domain-containing protein [Sedimentisphaerales bacterium]
MTIWDYAFIISGFMVVAILAYYIGRKLAPKKVTESKTTTFLIKSIQAIAELAVLEYITEGVAEIKEKKMSLITVRWKRGLLRYTAKLKVGFDLDKLEYSVGDEEKMITITLPARFITGSFTSFLSKRRKTCRGKST